MKPSMSYSNLYASLLAKVSPLFKDLFDVAPNGLLPNVKLTQAINHLITAGMQC